MTAAQTRNDKPSTRPALDDRDAAIVARNAAAYAAHTTPQKGDFVEFSDGITHRISVLREDTNLQTSELGQCGFHLGNGYVSAGGGRRGCSPVASLTLTDETRLGDCWIFHHDRMQAGGRVEAAIPFRVWACGLPAPTSALR
jgi:hypothetical protein